jgi:hypothetical protein
MPSALLHVCEGTCDGRGLPKISTGMYPQGFHHMNIFTSKGMVSHDIDPQTIPEDRRAAYVALVAADPAQAESKEKIANDAVAAAVREHDRAVAAAPRSTFMDEHKAAVAAWKADH